MKINENQKVTLTLGQLKRLVKESTEEDYPYAGEDYMGNTYGVLQFHANYDKINKYDKVFLYIVDESLMALFGANSYEDFLEIVEKSGWFGAGEEDILNSVWNLDVNEVYDNVPHNFVEDFVWIRVK